MPTDPGLGDWHRRVRTALEAEPWAAVLVDYFGTLVTRTVPPWYVKLLAARRLVDQLGLDADPEEVYRTRVRAERELSAERVGRGLDPDCRLDDVAERLAPALAHGAARPIDPDEVTSVMLDVELSTERAVQQLDDAFVSALRDHAALSRLAIVSDSYLPRSCFDALLAHHDIADVFSDVFVSCEHGRTKRTGRLFEVVAEQLEVDPARVLVLGDDPVSDGDRPRRQGMAAVIRPPGAWEERKGAPAAEVERDVERRIGRVLQPGDPADLFPELALSLLVFVRRLHRGLRDAGARDAWFLAREGLVLARLLAAYQDELSLPARMRVTPHDLMVSRRATTTRSPALDRYLQQALDAADAQVVHVVDVGWKGTTQDQLAATLPHDVRLVGWYVGLLSPSGDADTKTGVLFRNRPPRSDHLEVFQQFKSIFEVLLTSAQGSVVGYELRDGRAVPVLDDDTADRAAWDRGVGAVQCRLERRFRRLCHELARSMKDDDELLDLAARHHARMVYRPSPAELRFVEEIPFVDAGRRQSLGLPPPSPAASSGNRLRALADPRRLIRGGGWPPLRMRAAGLGWLRFPYGWYKLASQRHRARNIRRARRRAAGAPS